MTDETATLELEDSGPGIDANDRERVFEPFYSTKQGGIGMGLAICRQVISSHGGKIYVEKVEPRGTVFVIELPLTQNERESTS